MRASGEAIARQFQLAEVPQLAARYNIAPTQPVLAIRRDSGGPAAVWLRWGLIPHWAKDAGIGARMINARAETVAEKPAFRSAFRRRRCLIVADGFYEWQKTAGKTKQPYFFGLQPAGTTFAFAGLWERWQDPAGQPVESCSIITTSANDLLQPIHDRMPVIIPAEHYAHWLDPQFEQSGPLQELLQPYPAAAMHTHPVSTHVNSTRNDDPACVVPISDSKS